MSNINNELILKLKINQKQKLNNMWTIKVKNK